MGTRGVPALYGGFETAVEEIGKRLAARGYDVTVYCRNPGQSITTYEGMTLVNVPALRHRIIFNFEGEAEGIDPDKVIEEVLNHVRKG